MAHRKIIGLAIGAAVLFALVSGSNAQAATALCKKTESPCSVLNLWLSGTQLSAATTPGSPAQFTTKAAGTVSCESTMALKTNEATASFSLAVETQSVSWSGCKLSGSACTVTSIFFPTSGSLTNAGAGIGLLTPTGGSFSVVCGVIINCTYTPNGPTLEFSGGGIPYVRADAELLLGTGKACPASTWDGKYWISQPSGVIWVSS